MYTLLAGKDVKQNDRWENIPNIIPWTFQGLYCGTTGERIMMNKKTIEVLPYRNIGKTKLTYYSDTLRIDQ